MNSFSRLSTLSLLLAVVVCSAPGCGGDGRFAVEGEATWNGQPIEEGYVELRPTDGQGQVVGADIHDGKFLVRTVPGEKNVSVTAQRKVGETAPTERIPHPEPIYEQFLPAKFNLNSDLRVTISANDPTLRLALEGEDASPVTPDPRASAARR